jgi:hypothetical protein
MMYGEEEVTTPTFFCGARILKKQNVRMLMKQLFQFEYAPSALFTDKVTFTVTGEPSGSTVVFTPAEVSDSKKS